MSGWQLGLRIRRELIGPLQNLLSARAFSVDVEDEEHEAVLLVATFKDRGDPIVMDAVGSWLLNLHAAESQLSTRREPRDTWSEGWSAVLGSFRASARMWVVPHWARVPAEATHVIHLESSLAFGIGGHPTTRGTLSVLDRLVHDDSKVQNMLDVGSGSGILSLAAGRLGIRALGIEPDEQAVAESQRNVERNGLSELVTFRAGRLVDVSRSYDIVAANLYPATIRSERDDLVRCTGSHLILSGFYSDASGEIRSYFPELDVVENYVCDGWSVLHLTRAAHA